MTNTTNTKKTDVVFGRQPDGYDMAQVDQYIARFSQAYQELYEEYNAIYAQNGELAAKVDELRAQQQRAAASQGAPGAPSAEIIANALVNTEIIIQNMKEAAQAESEKMKETARAELKNLIDDAYVEKARTKIEAETILAEAKAEAEDLVSGARRELFKIREDKALIAEEIGKIAKTIKSLGYADEIQPMYLLPE